MMLLLGNCLEQMKTLEANSVDAVVTDPPYGLAFMNKKWDYDVPSVDIWREVYRVLKPGGHVLSFGGTRTYHRMVVNIEDAGFEIRDQVQWIYGSGFPKSHNVSKAIDKMAGAERPSQYISDNQNEIFNTGKGNKLAGIDRTPGANLSGSAITPEAKQWDGWGSALKPANEPICLARKPLEKGLTLAENVLKYGTGAINVDGCRIEAHDLGALQKNWDRDQSKTMEQDRETYGKFGAIDLRNRAPQGRWPANVLFDEDAAEMLDVQSGHLATSFRKNGSKVKADKGGTPFGDNSRPPILFNDSGGASRFFYVAKASKRERNAGLEGMPEKISDTAYGNRVCATCGKHELQTNLERRCQCENPDWQSARLTGVANFHPTVKPIKLMEYLITLITPPNGKVLDPFMGSGSTGVACKNLGFNFIGCEMNEEYMEIAKKRIEHNTKDQLEIGV